MPVSHRLHLLRHVKSAWDSQAHTDHDRPLAPRGVRAVALLRDYVVGEGIAPELVLCSTARRAEDTARGVLPGAEPVLEPRLYGASAGELLSRLRAIGPDVRDAMVVGHNPALQLLVLTLADDPHRAEIAEIRQKLPTGALVTLEFSGPWSELAPAGAQLIRLVRPTALAPP